MTDHPYTPSGTADDGWGPATSVRVGEGRRTSAPVSTRGADTRGADTSRADDRADDWGRAQYARPRDDGWSPAGPLSGREQRETKRAEREQVRAQQSRDRAGYDAAAALQVPRAPERGLPWWAAVLTLIVIAVIGVLIDTIGSSQERGGFNIGIVVAAVIAILTVKRSHMFPVVIAPPIVYSVIAIVQLYSTSGGLHDKREVFNAAANYLVYGFPAIAAATAAVLIIAGVRLIARK